MKKFSSKCGGAIALDEKAEGHLLAHPEAGALLEEAIGKIVLPEESFLLTTVDLGRFVGKNACVEVVPGAKETFAIRKGRDVPTRVIVGVEKPDTSLFTVIAGKGESGEWELYTGFTGPSAPREPHDRFFDDTENAVAAAEALEFWTTHGLVWEASIMDAPYESTWAIELERIRATRAATARK